MDERKSCTTCKHGQYLSQFEDWYCYHDTVSQESHLGGTIPTLATVVFSEKGQCAEGKLWQRKP